MSTTPLVFLPAAAAQDAVESLPAFRGHERPWVYWLCLLAMGTALVALPLVQVDLTIRSAGIVRPVTARIDLKSTITGRVARVLAHDNEYVQAGAPLLELAAFDVEERIARNHALQREKRELAADLRRLTGMALHPKAATEPRVELPAADMEIHTPNLAQALSQLRAHLNASQLALDQARRFDDRTAALATKGLVADRDRDDARYALARASSDQQLLIEEARSSWQTQLLATDTVLAELVSEEKRLREELALATLRAPVTGTVQGLMGLGPGASVVAGQSLGDISPSDGLVVETAVAARDIGLVRAGQPVRLQVDAFPYTLWGLLAGTVESVAADASSIGGQTSFRVVVRPAALALYRADGAAGTLRKGMTLTARFVVTRRSLLQVLYEDASGWLNAQSKARSS